ncbi:hypothetical protein K501DRAFT_277949 [Backusella circina FSU 941]|nr:hypothetical protein K501DRAFT_277949 [Backusella circina FSU 941]
MNAQKFLSELRHRESSDSPPQVTLRALVPHYYVDMLYHTEKGYISKLNTKYRVKLYALSGSGARLLFVAGSPRAISNAWGHLFTFFLNKFPLAYGETMSMSFLVPDKLAYLLQNSNMNSNHLQSIAKRKYYEYQYHQ